MTFTQEQLQAIFNEAIQAGLKAGQARLDEIKGRVAFTVHNADVITGKAIGPSLGGMHDLCGFAYCMIPKRVLSTRSKAVKALMLLGVIRNNDYERALCLRLPYIDQGITVNEASAQAAADVLNTHGLGAYMTSRLD